MDFVVGCVAGTLREFVAKGCGIQPLKGRREPDSDRAGSVEGDAALSGAGSIAPRARYRSDQRGVGVGGIPPPATAM
jgi:hypothetical protein